MDGLGQTATPTATPINPSGFSLTGAEAAGAQYPTGLSLSPQTVGSGSETAQMLMQEPGMSTAIRPPGGLTLTPPTAGPGSDDQIKRLKGALDLANGVAGLARSSMVTPTAPGISGRPAGPTRRYAPTSKRLSQVLR